jgi:hypothetical protein
MLLPGGLHNESVTFRLMHSRFPPVGAVCDRARYFVHAKFDCRIVRGHRPRLQGDGRPGVVAYEARWITSASDTFFRACFAQYRTKLTA